MMTNHGNSNNVTVTPPAAAPPVPQALPFQQTCDVIAEIIKGSVEVAEIKAALDSFNAKQGIVNTNDLGLVTGDDLASGNYDDDVLAPFRKPAFQRRLFQVCQFLHDDGTILPGMSMADITRSKPVSLVATTPRTDSSEVKQWREKEKEFLIGRFFAQMGDVWGVEFQEYRESHWAALHRSYPDADDPKPIKISARRKVSSGNRSDTIIDPYSATIEKIKSENDGPAEAASTRTESDASTNAKNQIWPVDISGEKDYNPQICQVAHLLPAGKKEQEEWFGVGAAALGIPKGASTLTKLMATRGVKRKKDASGRPGDESSDKIETDVDADPKNVERAPRDVNFTEGTNTEPRKKKTKERFDHTGVVHFASNKIRMKNQRAYFDGKTPLSLLVPCMTLEQARGWRGEAYKAVFLAGLPMEYPPPVNYNTDVPNFVGQAYIETGFASLGFYDRYVGDRAAGKLMEHKDQVDELEKARKLLEDAVLGLSYYVKSLKDTDLTCLKQDNREQLVKRSEDLNMEAPIPKKVTDPGKPVLFVDFGPTTGGNGFSHPAPDPLLLVAKAGTVWGTMTGFQLVANAEEPTDEEDSLDRLAEEAWLAKKYGSRPTPPVPTVIFFS